MLFYSQLKKEFSKASWKYGQSFFYDECVKGVQLSGDRVIAHIVDGLSDFAVKNSDPRKKEKSFEIEINVARGTVTSSRCACPTHKIYESHCRHVAALCIWLVERGSLLRAGIVEESKTDTTPKTMVRAEPVLFVRPVFENRVYSALRMEAAVRFEDPKTKEKVTETINTLFYQDDESDPQNKVWKNGRDIYIKVGFDNVPFLGSLGSAPVVHIGEPRFEVLAQVLKAEDRSRIVFHTSLNVELEPENLILSGLNIGKKTQAGRVLSYEFTNSKISLNSIQLAELSVLGCVSNRYVWPMNTEYKNKIFYFDTPLLMVQRYANRSGIASAETSQKGYIPEGCAYLEDDHEHPLHPLAAYRLSLELGVKKFTVDSDWAEFHDWRKNFEKKKIPVLPSANYGFDLRAYQHNGLTWIWSLYHRGLASLLADDMGLGKTHQVLAFLTSLYTTQKKSDKPRAPTLVVAPTSVVTAWVQKLEKYPTGLKWQVFHGKGRVLKGDEVNLVLTTYGILQKEVVLRTRDWEVVVLDEAQAIKNASTISSRASRILKSKFRIAMTGTPIENQSSDLWSVMEFLLPGYLGSLPRFKRLYGAGREIPNHVQAGALKRLVSPFLLRRTKSQVLKELPEKTEEIVSCELSPAQKKAYRMYLDSQEAERLREELQGNGKIDYAGILAMLTRLKQVCDHPILPTLSQEANQEGSKKGRAGRAKKNRKSINPLDSGKWEAFEEIIFEALRSDLKVVVFTQYLGMIDIISNWLTSQNVHHVELRGATLNRQAPLHEFATNPECKIFVCSLLAGGLGIDLTSASVCIHFDRWWNPAKENQATDRLHRIGQTRGVQVFKLQCPDTIEDRIASIIESKVTLSETLIEESPVGLKAFSRKELLNLLSEVEPS